MTYYKITDIERALRIMYSNKVILSKPTMIRYLRQDDPILIPPEWKKLEDSKNKPSWFITREGIEILVENFNKGEREKVDFNILMDLVERISSGEEIDVEFDIKTAYERVNELEKLLAEKEEREKDLKRKLEEAIRRSNEIEHKHTYLLTEGKKKDDEISEYKTALDKQKEYLRRIEEYHNTNPIVRMFKGMKYPKLEG